MIPMSSGRTDAARTPGRGDETMTTNRAKLINDAKAAGYSVEMCRDGSTIRIVKKIGRWQKPVGIVLYDDGTAFDVSLDLCVARGLRSFKSMRSILELK
jgi:hypothetical protein